MKSHIISILIAFSGLIPVLSAADEGHKNWVELQSMSQALHAPLQTAQQQIMKLSPVDSSSPEGRKAGQLVNAGKQLQQKLMTQKDQPLSKQQLAQMNSLILQMDQAAGKPASGTQGACFSSCDGAYGSGFGGGKGWNRFWCKASCFKINVNVGPQVDTKPAIGSFSGQTSNTAPLPAQLKP